MQLLSAATHYKRPVIAKGFLMPSHPETFGAWLKRTRLEKKLTLEAVGDRLDTSHVTIQRYESGARNVQFDSLHALAGALGVPYKVIVQAWVERNAEEAVEITYEPDADFIRVPEGYHDLDDPVVQAGATEMAQKAYAEFVEQMRKIRAQTGIGVGLDTRYPNKENTPDDEAASDGSADG